MNLSNIDRAATIKLRQRLERGVRENLPLNLRRNDKPLATRRDIDLLRDWIPGTLHDTMRWLGGDNLPKKNTMRYAIIAASLLATVLVAGSASAQGTNGNFCAQMKGEPGKPANCSYQTLEQCQQAVKSDQGTCAKNPSKM